MRRWVATVLTLVALVGLACKVEEEPSGTPPPGNSDLPSSMAALGDSITVAYGSCLAPTACPRNSWSTGDGTQVNSHFKRIRSDNPAIKGHAKNLAANGATSADLARQAALVQSNVEYVTVLIGANDACRVGDMTPVDVFRDRVDGALAAVKDRSAKARLLVVSIPDVYRVWEVGHTSKVAVKVWANRICPRLLANPTSTAPADTARRQAFRDRINAYNRELSRACRAYGSRCRYDGGAVHAVRFSLDQLSALDFFHPNGSGQNKLAAVTWAAWRSEPARARIAQ